MDQIEKENWLPQPNELVASDNAKMMRRRSTGIMKGPDGAISAILSPKPAKKRSKRRKSLNKRVSFGGVDVRLYQKDTDWTSPPTGQKKKHRSVDVGQVPFNDVSSPVANTEKAPVQDGMLLNLITYYMG